MTQLDWHLECSDCGITETAAGLPTVCPKCARPWLVRYPDRSHPPRLRDAHRGGRGMWRFRDFLPLAPGEEPVALGEGNTPLLPLPSVADALGLREVWIKEEGVNATGSFKARGIAMAVTRAVAAGARKFTLPTAGNAGVAASAYAARAGAAVRVFAPSTTPAVILQQVVAFGGELVLVDGHIGDCGAASRQWAGESGAVDLSTLREPYRIEGKKTLGLEIAEQFDWQLPDAIIYPTGGGTGLIGMWKAFAELRQAGWLEGALPRMYSVQATGCAPIVRAFEAGVDTATPWPDPMTVASGLRVPGALGDKLILRALAESGGGAMAVDDEQLSADASLMTAREGIDCGPEGGATLSALRELRAIGRISADERVVIFNTGSGWLYRSPTLQGEEAGGILTP